MTASVRFTWLALLLVSLNAAGYTGSSNSAAPTFTAVGSFFAIVVTDLDASADWYESNLGLHMLKRGRSPRLPAETAVLEGHNLFVELIHHDGQQSPRVDNEASVPRLIKAGVIVASKDFDAISAALQKRGIDVAVFEDKQMGVRSFVIQDNEHNLIQFFARK